MEDNRKYVRINDDIKIFYQPQKILGMITTVLLNFSEGGMRLPVLHNFQSGMYLRLEFSLAGSMRPIVLRCVVQWVKETKGARFPYEVGVKFIKLDPEDRKTITKYIENFKNKDEIQWLD